MNSITNKTRLTEKKKTKVQKRKLIRIQNERRRKQNEMKEDKNRKYGRRC